MRLQIWTYVVQFFQICFSGSVVNTQCILSHLSYQMGSWERKRCIYSIRSEFGQNKVKKRKFAFDKPIFGGLPYNFPPKILIMLAKFWAPNIIKKADFLNFSLFLSGVSSGANLGVQEVAKWPFHDSIQVLTSWGQYFSIKLKKVFFEIHGKSQKPKFNEFSQVKFGHFQAWYGF